MTALDTSRLSQVGLAQARLGEARQLLLQPTPASLESCRDHFGEVAQILEELIAVGPVGLTPEVIKSIRQIQRAAQDLQTQIEHGSRFCTGFLQMRMGVGYTDRGAPVMLESMRGSMGPGEGRSFEL